MSVVATVFIDEIDVSGVVVEGSSTRRLNRPSEGQIKIPMTDAIGGPGSLVKIYFDGVLHIHGRVMNCETSAGEDFGYTVYNFTDPLELWKWRPVRDSTGNFILPGTTNDTDADLTALTGSATVPTPGSTPDGPSMIEAMYDNSINAGAGPPADCEGPLFLRKGTVTAGTINLSGAPVDWPMTMAQLAAVLISSGEVDVVITPIELTDNQFGYMCGGEVIKDYAEMTLKPGNYGTDLTATVKFQYGMGAYNVRALRWNQDMSELCNKLWYYLGPKCDEQHFQANIVGTAGTAYQILSVDQGAQTFEVDGNAADGLDPGDTITVSGSTGNDGDYTVESATYVSGTTFIVVIEAIPDATGDGSIGSDFWTQCGVPSGEETKWQDWHDQVVACAGTGIGECDPLDSRGQYGVRMDIRIYDALGKDAVCTQGGQPQEFCLYKKNWLVESWLRCQPRNLVHITPTRDTAIGDFDIGDLVLVEAVGAVKGGFSGAQRVYEYTISWDATDSVPSIGELQVSSDNSGFDA